jgi:PEP-CTERM motif
MKLRAIKMGLAAVLAGAMGTTAYAGLIPTASVTPEGDNYRYTYAVTLTNSSIMKNGNSFVIFDFNGYVPGSENTPTDFSFSTLSTGGTPGRTIPNDDPSLPNLIWTYTGSEPLTAGAVGDFSALSALPEAAVDADFSGRNFVEDLNGRLQIEDTITTTQGPFGSNPPPDEEGPGDTPGVPEPATLLLLAAGMPVVLGARYLRRRKDEVVA